MQTTHTVHDLTAFTMGEAYDFTQYSETVRDGHIMRTADGWAVMVEAWPVIVGSESDTFHKPAHDFHEQTANKYRSQWHEIEHNADQLARAAIKPANA